MTKRYLVVGGSRGIGYALSKSLLNEGHYIIYASRNANEELNNLGGEYIAWDAVDQDFPAIDAHQTLDGLVYCPGSITLKPFKSIKIEQFILDYQINLIGAVRAIQANLDRLKRGQNPSIVMFSTVAAQLGMPFHSSIAAAKAAVEGLTKSLAAELSPTIRVNCIAPSLTKTELAKNLLNSTEKEEAAKNRHPLKNIGTPEDLAQMAKFLLSPQASWITGQVFHVDGGLSSLKV